MRPYVKRRTLWVSIVMEKYFPDWKDWDEQVPIFDIRGLDRKTVETVGIGYFTRIMPRADAVAVKPDELLVLEFDKDMVFMHVRKLAAYIDSVKSDFVRENWKKKKITGIYVIPAPEARIEDYCKRMGFRLIIEPEPVS